jgi:hypothetical protein
MSALPPKSSATVAPFSDALGYRVLGFDKKSGDRLEMLRLRPQLASSPAFEAAVRERQRRLADFRHAAFARVRQIDRRTHDATLSNVHRVNRSVGVMRSNSAGRTGAPKSKRKENARSFLSGRPYISSCIAPPEYLQEAY